jgi:hypothetical protein
MTKDTIQSNIYKGQLKMYNYLNNVKIVPNNNISNNNIMSVKTYILAPNFDYINQQLNPNNKLNLLIKAVEYIEKQPIQNII